MAEKYLIRNSTAEFLIFQLENREQGVEVYYKDENLWATQKAMATLFDCSTDNVGLHLKNIFASGELVKESVTEKISATASDGKNYLTQFYSLDAIIAVGYRVNSIRATQFRQWATVVLRQFAIRGYVVDKKRMENGTFLSEDYFEHLLNAFNTGELVKDSVCRKFRRTAADGKPYDTQYYNLDAIISVGYRANSIRAPHVGAWIKTEDTEDYTEPEERRSPLI